MVILAENTAKQAMQPQIIPPIPSGISVTWRAVTHQGLMRMHNEDSHCAEVGTAGSLVSCYLFAIADGLGGHGGGDVASQLALKTIKEDFHSWNGGAADRLLDRSMRHANQEVFSVAQSRLEISKMQTTMTAAILERDTLTVGHVGDCRLYRVRHGQAEILTKDHSMANELLKMHLITPEQAEQHPGRHQLIRSVGSEPFLHIDIIREQLLPGDTYLLCCDGLWGEVTAEDIRIALQESNPSIACERLIRLALKSGAPDNITAIVFRVVTVEKKVAPSLSLRSILHMR